MIWPLFLHNLRENKILIISFTFFLFIYGSISIYMFDPATTDVFQDMLDLLPEVIITMMGFNDLGTELTKYLGGYLYGFIYFIFPFIFIIMVGNKLISKHVDSGSMTFILTTPYSRKRVVTTQLVFFILSLLFVLGVNVGLNIMLAEMIHPGLLKIGAFLRLNLLTFSVLLLLSVLTFFIGTIFRDNSTVVGISGGVLFVEFILNMLWKIDDNLEFLKFTTLLAFVQVDATLANTNHSVLISIILLLISLGISIGSVYYFDKKSLII